ncbi:MAG TPA: SRPBCC family protein [Bryobacteraceae bacterium]|nr:SRPBCC family protein [Bryobacteraceae bacterium]
MKKFQLRSEILVARSLGETFEFFENAANLSKITPHWLGFQVLTKDPVMRKGLEIDYRFKWLGFPMTWRTLITEYAPPFLFEDIALNGPYALWEHRHTFRPSGSGTIVGDLVTYALPLGIIGELAHGLIVHKQVTGIFKYRQQILSRLLGSVIEIQQPVITAPM